MSIKTIMNKILRSILNIKTDADHRPNMSVGGMYKLFNEVQWYIWIPADWFHEIYFW